MKPKNPIAVALRKMAKDENMARPKHLAQKAARAKWDKWRKDRGLPPKDI